MVTKWGPLDLDMQGPKVNGIEISNTKMKLCDCQAASERNALHAGKSLEREGESECEDLTNLPFLPDVQSSLAIMRPDDGWLSRTLMVAGHHVP